MTPNPLRNSAPKRPLLWWVAWGAVLSFGAFLAYGLIFGVVRVVEGPSLLPAWPMIAFEVVFFLALGLIVTVAMMAERYEADGYEQEDDS